MIRTSKHTTRFNNNNKQNLLNEFINEYKQAIEFYINQLFPLINKNYNSPKFISTKNNIPSNTKLSQRALKCAATQACGMIKAQTEKPRKVLWMIDKLKREGKDCNKLKEWLANYKFSKPRVNDNYKCELNSICCDLKQSTNFLFLQLKSIGRYYGKIRIPLKEHRQSLKWKKQGKILNSFLVSKSYVNIRYEIEEQKVKSIGKVIGADQGKITCLSLSDGQVTQKNKHGHDLNSILNLMSRKKKGSKGFRRVQEHRKNYINWSINQLNFEDIKKINLEKVRNIRKGKSSSRVMSHWTYTLIRDKLVKVGQEQKVSVIEQSCVYRSQRCSQCGLVRKSNRVGKLYCCDLCGYVGDADINASMNHEVELPDIDFLRGKGYNMIGFYWLESGIYDLSRKEFTVPCTNKTINN